MKLDQPRLEDGINRLYYVIWVIWFSLATLDAVIGKGTPWYREYVREALMQIVGVGLVFPALVRLAVRWVYRGFVPKPR